MSNTLPIHEKRQTFERRSQLFPKAQLVTALPAGVRQPPNCSAWSPVAGGAPRTGPCRSWDTLTGGSLPPRTEKEICSAALPYTCSLEDRKTQTNKVVGKLEAYITLSLTQFKCSCKTSSLLFLGTAEERCWKWSHPCRGVVGEMEREKVKAQRYRWGGGNRRGERRRSREKEKKEIIIQNEISLKRAVCTFLCWKRQEATEQTVITYLLSAMDKTEPYSFSLTLHWKLVAELLFKEEIMDA